MSYGTISNINDRKDMIRVLVIDDQKMMRSLLKDYISESDDMDVIGLACNGKEGVEQVFTLNPDVVLMDIEMPEMNGIEATLMLRNRRSSAKVLVVSNSYDDRYLAQALRNGANGYLLKTASPEELLTAIRGVNSGSLQFGSGVLQKEMSSLAPGDKTTNNISAIAQVRSSRNMSSRRDSSKISIGETSKHSAGENKGLDKISKSTSIINVTSHDSTEDKKNEGSLNIQDLELELSRIRAGYWVLKIEQKTQLRQITALWMGVAASLSVTILLFFLIL